MSADSRWLLALRVAAVQIGLTLSAALLWWAFGGSALAALAGGGAATFMSFWFALRILSVDAAADPEGFLRRLYRAEFLKFFMAVMFFVIAARHGSDVMAEVMTGFIAALMGYWFGLWPVTPRTGAQPGRPSKLDK